MLFQPILPSSLFPVTVGQCFYNNYVGAGANSKHLRGMGVRASLAADAVWAFRFDIPLNVFSVGGQGHFLRCRTITPGNAGVSKINCKHMKAAVGDDPSTYSSSTSEGPLTGTYTSLADKYVDVDFFTSGMTLNTIPGGVVVGELTFKTLNWTLASVLTAMIWLDQQG